MTDSPRATPAPPPGYPVPPGYRVPPQGHPVAPGYPVPPGYAVPPPGYGHPVYVPPPPPPVSPAGQPLASFADRLLATLVDAAVFAGVGVVLAIPAVIIFFAVIGPDLFEVRPDGTLAEPDVFAFIVPLVVMYAVLFAISFVLSYVYYVEMMFRSGQTLGKKVMKIRVVPLDPAATLDRGFAAKRFLVQNVAGGLVPFFNYLDGLWQLWDKPYQQCLHDKFAKTVVIKVVA